MIKRIDNRWLKKWNACSEGVDWFNAQKEREPIAVLKALMAVNKLDDANWVIVRLMSREQRIRYACYAAKQVLHSFEEKYPDDKRPREAINAALRCIKNNTPENKSAARSAARSAAWSAESAVESAAAAAWSAESAASAAWSAVAAAQIKILRYGIRLLRTATAGGGRG